MNCSEMNHEVSSLREGHFFSLSLALIIFWFAFLEQNCFYQYVFLLNKPERFTCTVQQSKAKANKRDINPSYCVNQLFTHKFDG